MMMLTIKALVVDEDVEALLHAPHADRLHERLHRALCSEFGRGAIMIEATLAEPFTCGTCDGAGVVNEAPCPECAS